MSELSISPMLGDGERLAKVFREAVPFPLVVLDDFLDPALAQGLLDEFPAIDEMPHSRDYVFGNKHELSSVAQRGPASRRFFEGALSPEMATFLSELSGHRVFVDPEFHGGGFHQGGDGSYLDLHVDFNIHPHHPSWLRTLNMLLYLTPDWRPEYGGQLLLKRSPADDPIEVWPEFNRAVIMLTSGDTYHGYRRMSLPPGTTRKSIATYAYRTVDAHRVRPRTTGWAPEEAGPMKRLLARNYNWMVHAKNRVFGSGTARNR